MKVDQRALSGIERKITRAGEHLCVLYDEMAAWDARRPWRLAPEVHAKGAKHFYRVRLLEPIPVDWSVILGEAIHDIRSALDQVVYWLSVDWNGKPVAGSQFPVYRRKRDFEAFSKKKKAWSSSGGMYKIRGIGPGPEAFIKALQPYPQRDRWFYCRNLWTIHNLWNQDKHRLVHLWGLRFEASELLLPAKIQPDCFIGIDRRVLHDGAIAIKVICDPPHAEVKMKGKIGADLTFASGTRRPGGGNELLWHTLSTGADVVRKLTGAVGRQYEPISRDIWTGPQRASEMRANGFF